jgi:DNA-3-methyladenine glycosylase II
VAPVADPAPPARRPRTLVAAARLLAQRDRVVAGLVDAFGLPRLRQPGDSHFAALVQSVVYQQLAGAAASTIHRRLVAALGGDVTPEAMLATDPEALRGAGLSGNKAASVCDLAVKVLDGTVVLDPRGLAREGDEEVIERLTTVRGIGRWTAEMFLLFQLRRLDVWPTGELGVRKGFGVAWALPMPSAKELAPLGDPFRPYRSVVAWYCWRAAEEPGQAPSPVTG